MAFKNRRLALLGILCLAVSAHSVPPSHRYVPGEILIQTEIPLEAGDAKTLRKVTAPGSLEKYLERIGVNAIRTVSTDRGFPSWAKTRTRQGPSNLVTRPVYLLQFSDSVPVLEMIPEIENQPGVVYAEPNYLGSLCVEPSDELYRINQRALYNNLLGLEQAWEFSTGSPDVTIAILDSGIDPSHPEFAGRITDGTNILEGSANTDDPLGHGTRVAGIIGARGNEPSPGGGITGICWDCRLMPVVLAGTDGKVTVADAAQAIEYAWRHGADVINMSFAIGQDSKTLEGACSIASQFAILTAAAGNQGQDLVPLYPASYEPVLGVAALFSATQVADFSNRNLAGVNESIDLAAPGVGVFTTIPGGMYDGRNTVGTSFACPMVSGVAALLRAKYPTQSPAAISHHLKHHAHPIGSVVSEGRLDAAAAVSNPMEPLLEIVESTVHEVPGSGGDGDDALDAGEYASLIVNVLNNGADVLSSSFDMNLISHSSAITVTTGSASLPALAHGQSAHNTLEPFHLHVSESAPQTLAMMTLQVQGLADIQFPLMIEEEAAIPTSVTTNLNLTQDRTWIVSGLTTVSTGATLTAQPGVTVKFEDDARLEVHGTLSSVGTEQSPIEWKSRRPPTSAIFEPARTIPMESGAESIAIGDLNQDGRPDIQVGTGAGSGVLWNEGNGEFSKLEVVGGGGLGHLADMNLDGILDIVYSNHSQGIGIILGIGDGEFGPSTVYPLGGPIVDCAIGDVTQDGFPDILSVNHWDNSLTLLASDGLGDWIASATFETGNGPTEVLIDDVDGDHLTDICAINWYSGDLTLLVGDGAGNYSPHPQSPLAGAGGYHLRMGDMNGDGLPDLVTASDRVSIYLNDGNGGLALLKWVLPNWQYRYGSIITPDLDGDGLDDLVVGYSPSTVGVFLGAELDILNGHEYYFGVTGSPLDSDYADLDGDGILDVATANGDSISLLMGSGGPRYESLHRHEVFIGNFQWSLSALDVNQDGHCDVVGSQYFWDNVIVLLGNAQGGLEAPLYFPVGVDPVEAIPADLNQDSIPDILTVNRGPASASPDSVSLLWGEGGGNFSPAEFYAVGDSPYSAAIGDINEDGRPDVAVSNLGWYTGQATVSLLLGEELSGFVNDSTLSLHSESRVIRLGDVTGNGHLDIVTSYSGNLIPSSSGISLMEGHGNGTFSAPLIIPGSQGAHAGTDIGLIDVTGDGLSDIVFTGEMSVVSVLQSLGGGSFGPQQTFPTRESPGRMDFGDVNGDFHTDIAVAHGSTVGVFFSDGEGSLLPEITFPAGKSTFDVALGDFSGDERLDMVCMNRRGVTPNYDDISILMNDGQGGYGRMPTLMCLENSVVDLRHSLFTLEGSTILQGSGNAFESRFEGTGGTALAAEGNVSVRDCTAQFCVTGFSISSPVASGLHALNNRGVGMLVNEATDCRAEGNRGIGVLARNSLRNSTAVLNGGIGLYSFGSVVDCLSARNLGVGIRGSNVTESRSAGNSLAGVVASGTVSGTISASNGSGIHSPTIENCLVIGSSGAALAGAEVLNDSVLLENRSISTGTVHFNSGVLADNGGPTQPTTIHDMYIAGNADGGVDGIGVTNCSIIGNHGPGIANNILAASCNVAFNTGEGVIGGVISGVFLAGNAGGDLVGGALGTRSESPVLSAPVFLSSVRLDREPPVGVGPLNIEFEFSKDMATSRRLWVTFGQEAPYTSHVMESALGWIDSRTWRASFPISGEVGTGTHTLRVSGAESVDGFQIPPDTYHGFRVDAEGGLSLANGRVIDRTRHSLNISWTPSDNDSVVGYIILRAGDRSGPFEMVGNVLRPTSTFLDTDLQEDTEYFYQVYEYDSHFNHQELTQPFSWTTGNPVTPTPSPSPTATVTPTPSPTPSWTLIPSGTPSSSPTASETVSGSETLTPTPTVTPDASVTDTPNPTSTPSATRNFDLYPPEGDGKVDGNDLLMLLESSQKSSADLFLFTLYWKE